MDLMMIEIKIDVILFTIECTHRIYCYWI